MTAGAGTLGGEWLGPSAIPQSDTLPFNQRPPGALSLPPPVRVGISPAQTLLGHSPHSAPALDPSPPLTSPHAPSSPFESLRLNQLRMPAAHAPPQTQHGQPPLTQSASASPAHSTLPRTVLPSLDGRGPTGTGLGGSSQLGGFSGFGGGGDAGFDPESTLDLTQILAEDMIGDLWDAPDEG